MKKVLTVLLLLSLTFCGCRIRDERELVINVPRMNTMEDVTKVRNALASLGGVDLTNAVFDQHNRKITVRFDSMVVAHKNIEIAIAEAGYDANEISAVK